MGFIILAAVVLLIWVLVKIFHRIIATLRLESPLRSSTVQPPTDPMPINHVPQCHISVALEHLQLW